MPVKIINKFKDFAKCESGATAIEYSLIAGLIFIAIIASVTGAMNAQTDNYDEISTAIDSAVSP